MYKRQYETRPHLFAYYQPAGESLPPVLAALADLADVPAPFYIAYMSGEGERVIDTRVVSVAEHALV